jgi:hypothetical protein
MEAVLYIICIRQILPQIRKVFTKEEYRRSLSIWGTICLIEVNLPYSTSESLELVFYSCFPNWVIYAIKEEVLYIFINTASPSEEVLFIFINTASPSEEVLFIFVNTASLS